MPRDIAPELSISVTGAHVVDHAAVPTLAFVLGIEANGAAIRALMLRADIRIALARRAHDVQTRERLLELFGTPAQWRAAPQSLAWTVATVLVPAFAGVAVATVPVPCTYDFEVTAAKYFHAVGDGVVPLEFLFTGTIFYEGDGGQLRTALVPWDREASFALPVGTWKQLMQRYFPDTAWLRVRRESFDRLWAFKAHRALPTWDDALDALLREREEAGAWMPS